MRETAEIKNRWTSEDDFAARALMTLCRIDAAIARGTVFTPRLASLRGQLARHVETGDRALLSAWLAEFADAIDGECRAAERAGLRRNAA